MKQINTFEPLRVQVAKLAVLEQLRREWPNPVDLTPETLSHSISNGAILKAASELREEGFILYEALLLSSVFGYRLVDAALTRRGQLHVNETG
jgi:hypothetical protein